MKIVLILCENRDIFFKRGYVLIHVKKELYNIFVTKKKELYNILDYWYERIRV